MAESGRNLSDFSGSLSRDSAEDVDHFCDPCLTIGQQVDAHKYCVDCGEYLCKTCSEYHLRTKALRNHQLVDKDKFGKHPTTQGSEVFIEMCSEHKQEVIKYFCLQHKALGCNDCMTMNHRTCEIDYIPEKCADIANSEEYRRTVHRLDLKLQELNEITKTTKVRDQEIYTCQSVLRSDEIKAEDGLERTAQQYIFERNSSLMNKLSKQDAFGKLSLDSSILKTPRRNNKPFQKLSKNDEINVRTKSDKKESRITGCAVLSSNKLVLADYSNNKVKLVNIHTKSVVEETSLDSRPWDVAVLSEDQIAVTKPDKRQVVIMTCDDRLSTARTISVKGECYGITHHHGQLYVVCKDPVCVLTLDKQGNVQNKISLNKEIFSYPQYLVVSEDSKLLYISDTVKDYIASITLQGEVTAVYKQEDLWKLEGMLMLDDGSLLVCCYFYGSIHRISGDLKQGQKVVDGLWDPFSICYNQHLNEVYIGSRGHSQLTVLIPQGHT